jgi:hypothetical protein
MLVSLVKAANFHKFNANDVFGMDRCRQDARTTTYIVHNSTPWSKVNLSPKPEKGRPFARRPFVFPGIFPNAIRK